MSQAGMEFLAQMNLTQIISATLMSLDALWFNVLSYALLDNPLEPMEWGVIIAFILGAILSAIFHPESPELTQPAWDSIITRASNYPIPAIIFLALVVCIFASLLPIIAISIHRIKVIISYFEIFNVSLNYESTFERNQSLHSR